MKHNLVFILISILFINQFTIITLSQSIDDINIDTNLIKKTESLIKEKNFLINNPTTTVDIHSLDVAVHIGPYEIIKNNSENIIFIQDFGTINTPGLPKLPCKIISFALPPNSVPIRISYKTSPSITIPGNYLIPIVTIPICNNTFFSQYFQQIYEQNKNTILSEDTSFPKDVAQFVRTSGYRNYNLIDIEIYPCSYKPLSHQLSFFSDLILTIEYELPQSIQYASFKRDSLTTEKIAKNIIYNYNESQDWYYSSEYCNDGLYNYVIITLDSLTDAVTPLVEWETTKGKSVKVVTTSWIDSEYTGRDFAEKIRNFLRDKYPSSEWGIEDLLLVGHRDDLPMRRTCRPVDPGVPKIECDYYYAELSLPDDESWDANGNNEYGESDDIIDFYNEINVGRIPWSDYETVHHICEKSVAFEQNNDPKFKNNILLLAAFTDDNTDGAILTERCVNEETNPWMARWMKTRVYEESSTYPKDFVLNHQNVVNIWSSGTFSVVSWHAPGTCTGSYVGNQEFINIDDCSLLNDEYPAIISAASPYNSDTDYLNLGQAMMKQGAVGFLGGNKGMYYQVESDRSFKYYFVSSVTSGEFTQGQAHQNALREMYSKGLWVYPIYETFCHGSLWGNPDLGIAPINFNNSPPVKPMTPDGPSSGKKNTTLTFTTVSNDPDGDDLYYCWSWGDGIVDWFGPFESGDSCEVSHVWNDRGNYEIKVIARDVNGAESEWSDPQIISMTKKISFNPFIQHILSMFKWSAFTKSLLIL